MPAVLPSPVVAQMLFIVFFPTMAITARTSSAIRIKLIMYGALCFLLFVGIQILITLTSLVLDPLQSLPVFRLTSISAAILAGGLMVEVALFSCVRIPTPTKIKPVLKRRYTVEYLNLAIILVASSIILYLILTAVGLDASSDSYSIDFIHLGFWLNVPIIVTFSYFIANLLYEIKRPVERYKGKAIQDQRPLSVTFLISAYNEEKLIGQCIKSIDIAAAKYAGKVGIVIVNDGSKDRTEQVISESFANLKNCSGKYYSIPNSGKGYALAYGLERTAGDIIFRTDADSILDENALTPMMKHFKNPEVGSVSTWIMPLKGETVWLKTQNVLCSQYFYTKRAQEMMDGIITQPGPSTAYRRDVLIAAGGWVKNIFGEDGEITNRVSRLGYRQVLEGDSLVYSRMPTTLLGFMQQRTRWSVAFFHSRGRNIRLAHEFRNSRSLVFLWNLLSHGMSLGRGLLWPYMALSLVMGVMDLSTPEVITFGVIVTKLLGIQVAITVLNFILWSYRLKKIGMLSDMKYFPLVRFLTLVLNWIVKPQAVEVLLTWSARWNDYNDESFKDLRREVHKSVDPRYPAGDYERGRQNRTEGSVA
jgi:cellulose synthase/poly-beta-1,6-N-acetylglucosamine synthase-like glycosyltransferase